MTTKLCMFEGIAQTYEDWLSSQFLLVFCQSLSLLLSLACTHFALLLHPSFLPLCFSCDPLVTAVVSFLSDHSLLTAVSVERESSECLLPLPLLPLSIYLSISPSPAFFSYPFLSFVFPHPPHGLRARILSPRDPNWITAVVACHVRPCSMALGCIRPRTRAGPTIIAAKDDFDNELPPSETDLVASGAVLGNRLTCPVACFLATRIATPARVGYRHPRATQEREEMRGKGREGGEDGRRRGSLEPVSR